MAPRARARRPLDLARLAEGVRRPGADTRNWLSFGTVDDSQPQPVVFDPDLGPTVPVVLQPGKRLVSCRVGMRVAGNGEAEYYPFAPGDEVLVAIPEGSERAGCVILCRLCNSIDKFPLDTIASQDPTTNAFGFLRTRVPMVNEAVGPWFQRQASTEALFGFDAKGAITLKDGGGSALNMTADALTYVTQDGQKLVQMDLTGGRFTLQVDDAILVLSASTATPQANSISVPGVLTLGTLSNPAAEHVTTAEAVAGMLVQLVTFLFAQVSLAWTTPPIPTPAPGAPLGAPLLAPLATLFADPAATILPAVLQAAATTPLEPALASAIFAAFSAAVQKPPGVPEQGQLKPGLGCPGLIAG